jgi:hypothetical protein
VTLPFAAPLLSSGGSGDVVPNAANWADITGVETEYNAAVTITGITQPIYLRADISSFSKSPGATAASLYAIDSLGDSLGGDSAIGSGTQIEFGPINNGDTVYFAASGNYPGIWNWSCLVTIKYKSVDGGSYDTTLDTFNVSMSGNGLL